MEHLRCANLGAAGRLPLAGLVLDLQHGELLGLPGSVTPVHIHPGSEAFYVLTGEQSSRQAHGTLHVKAGDAKPGHGADSAMQVSSIGQGELHALVMFVVEADKPFSSPARRCRGAIPTLQTAASLSGAARVADRTLS